MIQSSGIFIVMTLLVFETDIVLIAMLTLIKMQKQKPDPIIFTRPDPIIFCEFGLMFT